MGSHSLLQGNLPDPGFEPGSSALQADSFPCRTLQMSAVPETAIGVVSSWSHT